MLEAKHVTLSRGGKTLLEDASFLIGRGEKVGLVGVNGAGKTTLLRALHGDDAPDTGSITRPRRVGYLGQERLADALLSGAGSPVTSVRDAMLASRNLHTLASELRTIEAQLATVTAPEPAATTTSTSPSSSGKGHNRSAEPEQTSLERLLARYGDLEE
ncbi:MAG: ATP-binding cassette domain-containing protein, partial [Ktedonobacterales bacterium]